MLISAKAETLFLQALDLAEDARDAFLTDTCGGDVDLRREVTTLLRAATASEPYFDKLAGRVGLAAVAARPVRLPGAKQIGAWRLLRLLGRGGMGAVYLAERADGQYEAQAALKILPLGIRDASARARFVAERQILARLVHDNITRLLDGGVTDDGTPYFVMDYVDGMPIDGYCDTNRLNLEQRLALFLDVCDAVQFAHQNLVVHRDIKPGNVLVDASGTVRLLDFGIAKLLDPNETATELTQLARRPLTPAYASPEMLLAQPVDVTTDVYSLGVLCYRLLTGHLPVEFRRGLSAAEIEACVRCAPSVPASQAVLRDATVRDGAATDTAVDNDELAGGNMPAAELAARRRSDPRRLSARLSGDLDVILDTALARDRNRRYGSVELLARDLRCYREGLPILARRPTVRYRFGKFVRRHRVGLAAATVASLLLVGITAVSVRHAVVTERQSREIAAERDRAEEIKDFLQGVFLAADPSVSRGEELTAREILDRGARRLTDEMHDRPDLKADLLDTVADVYQGLGFFAEALPLIQQVAALRLELAGEQSPARGDALHKLAFLEEQLGDYELALEHAAGSVAIRRNSEQPVDLAATLIVQARTLHRLGRLEEAHPLYVEALALSRAALTAPDERLAHSLVSLGTLEIALGNIDEAEALQREALQMRLVIYPDPATELVESYYNLGTVLHRREKYEEAKVAYNAALDVVFKLSPQPEGHPDEAYMLNGLARVYESLDEYGEAEATFRKAADTLRRHLGDRHPNVGIVQFNLGNVLVRQERCAQAELPLSEAISILSESAPGVAALANAQSRLGSCRLADGRLDDARRLFAASFESHTESRGPAHAETKVALDGLIAALERSGEHESAAQFRALAVPVPEQEAPAAQ